MVYSVLCIILNTFVHIPERHQIYLTIWCSDSPLCTRPVPVATVGPVSHLCAYIGSLCSVETRILLGWTAPAELDLLGLCHTAEGLLLFQLPVWKKNDEHFQSALSHLCLIRSAAVKQTEQSDVFRGDTVTWQVFHHRSHSSLSCITNIPAAYFYSPGALLPSKLVCRFAEKVESWPHFTWAAQYNTWRTKETIHLYICRCLNLHVSECHHPWWVRGT